MSLTYKQEVYMSLTQKHEVYMSDNRLSNQTFQVNEEFLEDVFVVDPTDETCQYTIIPNSLIRDETISPECRWLIIYLLSNKPGWMIKSSQIAKHTKGFIGKEKIKRILKEAIEAGYLKRENVLVKRERGSLRKCIYTIASSPKFKKSLREPGFRAPDHRAPEDEADKELLSEELLSEEYTSLKVPSEPHKVADAPEIEIKKPQKAKPEFSPKVRELATQLINSLRRTKETYVPPRNLSGVLTEVDFMLRLDKRDPQNVLDVFNWAVSDSFWCDKMFKPNPAKYLREKFDQFEMQMHAKPQKKEYDRRGFAPCSNDADAIEIAKDMTRRAL